MRRQSARLWRCARGVVLAAPEGLKDTVLARRLGVTRGLAVKWRRRFVAEHLDGPGGEPHRGRAANSAG